MSIQLQTSPKRYPLSVIFISIVTIVFLMALPLFLVQDSEFGGSDGLGVETIESMAPNYNPNWTANVWEPPGSETESMLFALQATVGGILIGYTFGYLHGRRKSSDD